MQVETLTSHLKCILLKVVHLMMINPFQLIDFPIMQLA